nr:hypothetical protein [Tanacetum cinerariifolium]
MIPEPGDPNSEVPVNETFHVQTDDKLTEKELKQIGADDQAIQTILLGLPEDIYAAVDSCETAQEIWLRVQQMMKGSDIGNQEKNAKFTSNDGESIESYYHCFLKLMNDLKRNKHFPEKFANPITAMNIALALMAKTFKLNYSTPTNNNQMISSNPRNRQVAQPGMNMGQDRQMQMVGVQNPNGNGNLVAARAEGNATGHNENQIRCYNYRGQASTSGTQTDRAPVYDSDESAEDTVCSTSANTKFSKQSILRKPPKVGETHALSKPVTSNSIPTPQRLKVVKNVKVIAPGMFRINPFNPFREEKHVPNKVRASVRTNLIIVSQPPVITKKVVNSDSNDLSSTRVDNTKTRRPQPRSNTKNNRVPSASKSSCSKNKEVDVEEHHRKLQLSRKKKHMSSECNNVKLATQNVKSKVVCAMCKQCLISVNHDVCLLNYVNGMTSRGKKQTKNVSINEKQKKQQPNVKKNKKVIQICLWCVDSGCSKHMTGNLKLLINFVWKFLVTVRFENDHIAAILGFGVLQWGNILITRVKEKQENDKIETKPNENEKRRKPRQVDNTKTRRPQPRSNTKNDRVPSASKSSRSKNKELEVEEHHRKLLLSKNKKHMSYEYNNIKLATQNVYSKVVYAMCKQCLISVNHDVCLLNYVNDMNSRGKNQTANVSIKEKQKKQKPKVIQICLWCVDSGCSKHMTGNLKLLINFVWKILGTVRFRNDHVAAILGFGQFCDSDLEVAFRRNTCFVRNLEGVELLKGDHSTNLYTINLHEMAFASPICLMARASSTKSWLWHQRLSHLNFVTINDLAKNNLVSSLPKFKYHKEHLCPSCEQEKSKIAYHPPKPVPNSRQRLHLLHMDLCGPMRIASINRKRQIQRDLPRNTPLDRVEVLGMIEKRSKQISEQDDIVCRTHGVGSAYHARSDGVLVSAPTVVPQGLALLLADAAMQTELEDDT